MNGLARIKREGTVNVELPKIEFLDNWANVYFYLKNTKPMYFEGVEDEA